MARRAVVAGVVAGLVLLGAGACSGDGEDGGEAVGEATTSTTEAPATEPATAEASTTEPTTTVPATTEPTTTVLEELDNATIQAFVEEEHPDEAALVDWTTFRWVGFNGGYTAHVPDGTDAATGVAVCEALAEIVYQHSDFDPIAVVTGLDPEVPLARRDGPDGTCAPA